MENTRSMSILISNYFKCKLIKSNKKFALDPKTQRGL